MDGRKLEKIISVVDESIKKKLPNAHWANDLIQFATSKCEIDGLIAAGSLFCPELIIIDEFVFIKQFWKYDEKESTEAINILKKQFNNDKKEIEIYVNSCPIGELFLGKKSNEMNDEDVLNQFGNMLCYFWKERLIKTFPDRSFKVNLVKDFDGEIGPCIILYEE